MYPSFEQLFYSYSPYGHEEYDGSTEFLTNYNLDTAYDYDERLFGPWSPSQGGPMGMPPGRPPGRPPFTPPGQGQHGGPPGPPPGRPPFTPPGQAQHGGPPTAPPPSYIPTQTQQIGLFAVDPGAIRRCLFRYTYVWLTNRQHFWFYPTFVGRRSISGYRWNGFMWVYFGTDLRRIESFQCV